MKNYHQILGLEPGATPEEIKGSYRFLAVAFHPDKHIDANKAQAERKMKEINEAYQALCSQSQYSASTSSTPSPEQSQTKECQSVPVPGTSRFIPKWVYEEAYTLVVTGRLMLAVKLIKTHVIGADLSMAYEIADALYAYAVQRRDRE